MDKSSKVTEENIKVIVRIKPNEDNNKTFLTNDKDGNSIVVPEKLPYAFDKVADGDVTQEEIFETCKHLFQSFIDGYNATIFAYGQTGSGKTFTMTGECNETGITQNPGLIPKGLSFIFDKVNERALNNNVEFLIKCSFVEIYNEQIFDLLDPQQQKLALRFNISQEVFLEPVTELILDNPQMANEILRRGLLNRHMASTEMNRESSRSHAVFSIVLESRESQGDIAKIKKSVLYLVDLAGSERQKDAKTDGLRLKEAGMINKSLLTLSIVIRKLAESAKSNKTTYIAYRDSKLTLLLKDAIGGNSKTLLVACVHNDIKFMQETWSTLQFASSVKNIKNTAKINIETHGDNESLRKELLLLQEQLENMKSLQTIQDHEFDFDLVWKKRFISAMALRAYLCSDITSLNNQLTKSNDSTTRLENAVGMLKDEIETKNQHIRFLQSKIKGESDNDAEIKETISQILNRLMEQSKVVTEQVTANQLQMTVDYLTTELEKSRSMNLVAISDQAMVHSLLKDYNSLIESGELKNKVSENEKVEFLNMQQELSQSRYKCSRLKKKISTMASEYKDEKRRLEEQIASMKCNVLASDQQREAAVTDRRKTLLSINDIRPILSPSKNMYSINQRRRTARRYTPVIEEDEKVDDSIDKPLTEFIKENPAEKKVDQIISLENEIRDNNAKIGLMEYKLKDSNIEIEDLKTQLQDKEKLQKNLQDLEEKFSVVNSSLQESTELVRKLQKDLISMETTKDKTIQTLTKETFSLKVKLEANEMETAKYRDESEQHDMSLHTLQARIELLQEEFDLVTAEGARKDAIIESLQLSVKDERSLAEQLALVNEELLVVRASLEAERDRCGQAEAAAASLRHRVEELRAREVEVTATVDEVEALRQENERLMHEVEDVAAVLSEERLRVEAEEKVRREAGHALKDAEGQLADLGAELQALRAELDQLKHQNILLKEAMQAAGPPQVAQGSAVVSLDRPCGIVSPLKRRYSEDDGNRDSLINDLLASQGETKSRLDEMESLVAALTIIVGDIFKDMKLPMGSSIVGNITTIKNKMAVYRQEMHDLVVKSHTAEDELKKKTTQVAGLMMNLSEVKNQRDSFKNELRDITEHLPNVGHKNLKQKIQAFVKFKEENVRMREENIQLMDEKCRARTFIMKNGMQEAFEAEEPPKK